LVDPPRQKGVRRPWPFACLESSDRRPKLSPNARVRQFRSLREKPLIPVLRRLDVPSMSSHSAVAGQLFSLTPIYDRVQEVPAAGVVGHEVETDGPNHAPAYLIS
jgi:hypothetical protein